MAILTRISLLLALAALADAALADDGEEALPFSGVVVNPDNQDSTASPEAALPDGDVVLAPTGDQKYGATRVNHEPLRFGLGEKERFRKYIHELCKLGAVGGEESSRARINGRHKSISTALNKQGSLQLLLENYVDDLKFKADCEQKRTRDARACLRPRELTSKRWEGGLENWQSWQNAPAGADLLVLSAEKLKARKEILRREFHELRDASTLNGKPDSLATAEKILVSLRNDSRCRTTAVEISSVPSLARR